MVNGDKNDSTNTATTASSSSFLSVLDSMTKRGGDEGEDKKGSTSKVAAVASVDDDDIDFIASKTWTGSKPGFYFGTNDQGTGYYRDHKQKQPSSNRKRKRTVKIAEDQNELRIVPSLVERNKPKKEDLLKEAEQNAAASSTVVMELTRKGLRSATNALTKIVDQNSIQRAQFTNDPKQYMDSELALYDHITSLQAIAANVNLYQHILEEETLMLTLIQLLGHENTDVCASVIALFLEWVDPTLVSTAMVSDETSVQQSSVSRLSSQILQDAFDTIVANLERFQLQLKQSDDSGGEDQNLKGIDNVLSLIENILEIDLLTPGGLVSSSNDDYDNDDEDAAKKEDGPKRSAAYCMVKETTIVSWLVEQVGSDTSTEDLQGRCLEILAFLSQREDVHSILTNWSDLAPYASPFQDTEDDSTPSKEKQKQSPIDAIEILLQSIGGYRKKQPENATQVEFLENACIILSSCLLYSTANVAAFLDGQGIELVMRCLKERVHAGGSSLKLLDFFGSDSVHQRACEHIIEAGGLKFLLPMFMGTRIPKPALLIKQKTSKKVKREWLHLVETQTIRILYALSYHLTDTSPNDGKARFISKFLDDDTTKCDRLIELLLFYDEKARKAEYKFYRSDVEEQVDEEETIQLAALDAKLKGGGELFHRLGAITACLCVNSKRCHQRILSQLQLQQSGISLVKIALEEFISVLGPGKQKDQLQSYLTQI